MLTTIVLAAILAQMDQPTAVSELQAQQQEAGQDEPRYNRYRRYQLKKLPVVEVKLGDKLQHKFKTWVMDEESKRQEGMMFLEDQDVANDQAMIFVFKEAIPLSFWMKNTYIPLDIAYVDGDGVIVKTYTMRRLDTYSDYGSKKPAKYAIEFRSGTLKRLGVKDGDKVAIPQDLKAKN